MNKPLPAENVKAPLLTRGEIIGAGAVVTAVGALAVMAKMNPEAVQNFAENVLTFLGFHPLFENAVVTPQDGGPVM